MKFWWAVDDDKNNTLSTELLKEPLARLICDNIEYFEIDTAKIAEKQAVKILKEVSDVLDYETPDFEIVEKIVCIFEKYGISTNGCHDF